MTEVTKEANEDKPPFFDSWPKMYALVIAVLGILILLFYLFTEYYS